jgi:hypothetical protein
VGRARFQGVGLSRAERADAANFLMPLGFNALTAPQGSLAEYVPRMLNAICVGRVNLRDHQARHSAQNAHRGPILEKGQLTAPSVQLGSSPPVAPRAMLVPLGDFHQWPLRRNAKLAHAVRTRKKGKHTADLARLANMGPKTAQGSASRVRLVKLRHMLAPASVNHVFPGELHRLGLQRATLAHQEATNCLAAAKRAQPANFPPAHQLALPRATLVLTVH